MKLKLIVIFSTIFLTFLVFVIIYGVKTNKKTQPVSPPATKESEVKFCQEGYRGNDCVRCSCDSVSDCMLISNPYVFSECSGSVAVNKSTTDDCIKEVGKTAIYASCVVPTGYTSSAYEVLCVKNTCGIIER